MAGLQVRFGNGGAATQWYLPGTDTTALPAGPANGMPRSPMRWMA
jgi:hypothetical protein